MWMITSVDGKCVVRGKTKKSLCTLTEPSKKERVEYDTRAKAKAALLRMMPTLSDAAAVLYEGQMPQLQISEMVQENSRIEGKSHGENGTL